MAIKRGDLVHVTTFDDKVLPMRALGEPIRGRDFPVIWVCTEEEWNRANAAGDQPDGTPWPVEDVAELATT